MYDCKEPTIVAVVNTSNNRIRHPLKPDRNYLVNLHNNMIYLPPLRRLLLPTFIFVTLIILYRSLPSNPNFASFVLHQPPTPQPGIRVPISNLHAPLPIINNASLNHLSPPNQYFYSHGRGARPYPNKTSIPLQSTHHPDLALLFKCPADANIHTGHLRIDSIVQNISLVSRDLLIPETRVFWNPTVIALPYWSENQYLIVSRIVTDGNHQENVLCEANVCYTHGQQTRMGEKLCTDDDLKYLGPGGGMRCVKPPITLSVPPTPAEKCEGKFSPYVDIPGFHDPRSFWSGKGEPLMMVNTQ